MMDVLLFIIGVIIVIVLVGLLTNKPIRERQASCDKHEYADMSMPMDDPNIRCIKCMATLEKQQ